MRKTCFDTAITVPISITIILSLLLPALAYDDSQLAFANQQAAMTENQINNNDNPVNDNSSSSIVPKVVILNFYDDEKDQFINAKPILDKYGFRGTFFIVCSWTSSNNTDRMTWQDISQLYREGYDIESHSMTHKRLNKLSQGALDYEVGQSKQCIYNHIGAMPTVFSPPHNLGWNNATVINAIAKYYDLSIGGFVTGPMFLRCDGGKQSSTQTDCRTYSDNGTLNHVNRYDIKERTHNALDMRYSHNDTQIFDKFMELVNSQFTFNKNGIIDAIPIIGYHDIDNNKTITSTDVNLFDAEMKYLHDNGFKVFTMSDLGYDENSNYLYIKGLS